MILSTFKQSSSRVTAQKSKFSNKLYELTGGEKKPNSLKNKHVYFYIFFFFSSEESEKMGNISNKVHKIGNYLKPSVIHQRTNVIENYPRNMEKDVLK